MLFQRLYNWIKYKTLPTSFLFKNRLFIERDTKTKRIFSNLGLTFRSSKWSDYALTNVKLQFKSSFLFIFFVIIFLFFATLTCLYAKKYYMVYYSFNLVAFNLWFSSDSFDYYLSFTAWVITLFLSNMANSLHSYFFFNNFSNVRRFSLIPSSFKKKTKERDKFTPRHSASYLLYNWLNSTKDSLRTQALHNLFENNTNLKWWNNMYPLIHELYRANNYLVKTSFSTFRAIADTAKTAELNTADIDKTSILLTMNNSSTMLPHVSPLLWYIVNRTSMNRTYSYVLQQRPVSFDSVNGRNLQHITAESLKYAPLIHSKVGNFYTTNLTGLNLINYITNFKELQFFTENVSSQFLIAKWNRWLYRYSILHRKILKNSHKLTIMKRLLNSGLYNLISHDNAAWSTNKVGKLPIVNLLSTQFMRTFNDVNSDTTFLNHNINSLSANSLLTKINNLNNYENSFFFFVKRFFFFNTLPTNTMYAKKNLSKSINGLVKSHSTGESHLTLHLILVNYLLQNHSQWLTQYDLTIDPYSSYCSFDNLDDSIETIVPVKQLRDYFIYNNEIDLLSLANLNILYWTTLPLKTFYNFNFYSYLNLNNSIYNDNSISFFDTETDYLDNLDSFFYETEQLEALLFDTFLSDFTAFNAFLLKTYIS